MECDSDGDGDDDDDDDIISVLDFFVDLLRSDQIRLDLGWVS